MLKKFQFALMTLLFLLVCSSPSFSQTAFTKTYQLGGNLEVSCCTGGMGYGFTPLIQDHSLGGNIQITSIAVSDIGSIITTDPNGVAGTTWEIFVGNASCGFPVGELHGTISLSTYTCGSPTQLVFNTNGTFTAPQTGTFAGGYNFSTSTFSANDNGALVSASTVPFTLTQGLYLQILLWGGDVGADLKLNNISVTVTGTAGSVTNLGDIRTVAGGVPNNVPALSVGLGYPAAVAKDSLGNLYVGVQSFAATGGVVYKINSTGTLTTVAGNGAYNFINSAYNGEGDLATKASLGYVGGIYIDASNNLYISDYFYGTVRKVTASTGIITTVAGGGAGCGNSSAIGDGCPALSAILLNPYGIFTDSFGNLFIADSGNNRIREVVASTGKIQTAAGGGTICTAHSDAFGDNCPATSAILLGPKAVFVDSHNNLFISDTSNNLIREVAASNSIIQAIAGTGTAGFSPDGTVATAALINNPGGLFVDTLGDVFFADTLNGRVREITASNQQLQTLAGGGAGCSGQTDIYGDNCSPTSAILTPVAILVDSSANLFIADIASFLVREVPGGTGNIHAAVGNGTTGFSGDGLPATNAQLAFPYGVAVDASGNIFIADLGNERIRKVSFSTGIIETVAGGGVVCTTTNTDSFGDGCPATQAILTSPVALALGSTGDIFISDDGSGLIRKVSATSGIISVFAGGGTVCANPLDALGDGCPATQAILGTPWGLYVDPNGNVYFPDSSNFRIRRIDGTTGIITSVAGTGTSGYNGDNIPATQAQISTAYGIYGDSSGNIFFSDNGNYRVREIVASSGNIITVAGTGTPGYNGDGIPANTAEIILPYGIFVDHSGNIFFNDYGNQRLREVLASTGIIQTVAGNGTFGFTGDGGPAVDASLSFTLGLAGDANGNLYIADAFNNRIRQVFGAIPGNTLAITTITLPTGTVGIPYSFGLTAAGGASPYTWSLASGSLPPGFSALSSAGVLSGTPTTTGTFSFIVKLTDSGFNVQTKALSITINPATVTLQSITITPSTASLTVGLTLQYTATGHYSDGSSQNITNSVTWTALPTGIASISATGLATGVGAGTSTISASLAGQIGSATLNVTSAPPTLVSITLAPATPTLSVHSTQAFLAIGTYSDGSTQNLTSTVAWTSGTTTVATITSAGLATAVSPGTSTITATTGNIFGQTQLTVSPNAPFAYIGSVVSANCCLDVINTSNNQLVATIPVTTFNEPLGVPPDQTRVFVADSTNNLVDVVDTATNTLRTAISAGPGATAVVVTPNGNFGYVAQLGDNNISVYDSISNPTPVATIGIGFPAGWVSVTPDGSLVYAGSSVDNRVAVINTNTNSLSTTIIIAPPPGQLTAGCIIGPVFNPAGTLGYFLQSCASTTAPGFLTVLSIPSNTVVATIPLGIFPYDLAITPNGSQLYVVNARSNTVSVVNTSTNTLTTTIPVGNAPQSVAVTPDGSTVYVPNTRSSTVSLISTATNTVTSSFPLTTPFGIVIASPPAVSPFLTSLVLTPPSLLFGSHVVSTTSAPQTITVRNPGTTPVTLTSISLIGPNVADYSLVNSCPQPPATLAAGAPCNLQFTFKPLSAGARLALVSINSTNGVAASLQSAPLSGIGTGSTVATFSALTPSQSITAGAASVTLSGVIGNGTIFPATTETISISINGVSQTVPIGSAGAFSATFATSTIPASTTPYTITYSYMGNATLTSATNSSTALTVNPLVSNFTLTVTTIGTGNGTVTDNLQQINCTTTVGVQSGTCSASYAGGTVVTLTATPSVPSTFAGWGSPCSGTGSCSVTMTSPQTVTASFTPPPQLINLSFTPGSNQSGMATYDCPSNPAPSPSNPCTDPNAHALALAIPQVLQPFSLTVQASEVPPSVADGVCPNGGTPTTDFDCRFVTFFTYQTLANGNKIVPLCFPYANGNCVHYQVFSGSPGVEPNPSFYVGPIDWVISFNNDTFIPPAPYTGSTPRMYDDPDYAVSPTSPFGTNCSTPMLVGNPPVATNPPIFCQFEFDITTAVDLTKKVDTAISGRTKQFNDVVIAFPPANVGNLTVTMAPTSGTVIAGNPLSFVTTVTNSAGGAVSAATLTDALPAGTNVSWSISPAYSGPGTCAITGATGSQVLNCVFGTIAASQTFNISLLSSNSSIGTYANTAVVQIGNQQILSIGTIVAQAIPEVFSGLTASQSIQAGTTSIALSGTIGNGTAHPAPGETVSILINGVTHNATFGTNGTFSITFPTATIPASSSPYLITYSYAGDAIFSPATNSSTSLTVLGAPTTFPLTVKPIGTGNGTVTDNFEQINCTTTAGVQSGTCSANYNSGTVVTLTATPSSPSTFAGWGSPCSGTGSCSVTMTSPQTVTASFTPPPQLINLSFTPGSNQSGMATYDCPSNPAPSPSNPCTDPNAHALALAIPQVLQPFSLTVQASEVPPSVADGVCPNGGTPTTDFDCRFVTFFTYQTLANGNKIVPLCFPYANGNCVHYQVFSGSPGVEPNPSFYVGPIDWVISFNNDTFIPPAPYTGSTPRMYDDPDYAVSPTSPFGTNCSTPMLVGNPPVATNPPIFCQFEFDITTAVDLTKKVDTAISGRTKQFNDVVIALPPANVGNLTVTTTTTPSTGIVTTGSPLNLTIAVTNSAGGPVTGATLSDPLPAGTNVSWSISPAYSGPGTCAITGAIGTQMLNCSFATIAASQAFNISLLSSNSSLGKYTSTAVIQIGNQQILTVGSIIVTVPGDVNGDGVVNCTDLNIVKASFNKKTGQPGFDPRADVNHDGIVNILDLAFVARQIPAGTTCQ